ncbi:hypothetical protein [Halorhabdus rudnickae]|uniref:hypothetical protein n=1 Tax=Halorhabdus rudnickae TaxID=1775544 RepID=UPI0010842EEC|nr:hypothetical protein [Halorhabdus rudnickae]
MSDDEDESRARRRLGLLLLVLFIIILGAGIGTFTLIGDDSPPDEETPSGQPTTVDAGAVTTEDPGITSPSTPAGTGDENTPTETGETTPESPPDTTDDGSEAGGGGGGGGGAVPPDDEVTISLTADGEGSLLEAEDVVPGDTGTETMTLRNAGNRAGQVRLARTTITDLENGIVDPEAFVDDSPNDGELSGAIDVRLAFVYPDGTETRVIGSESSYVTLADVNDSEIPETPLEPGEELNVRLDWRVSEDVGNEIQTDEAIVDAVFQLRAPET